MGFLFRRMPTSYLPDEDQGTLLVQVTLPVNSTMEQTDEVLEKVYHLNAERLFGQFKDASFQEGEQR